MIKRLIRKLTPAKYRKKVVIDIDKNHFTYCAVWQTLEYHCLYKQDEIPEIDPNVTLKDYENLPPEVIGFKKISNLSEYPEILVSRGGQGFMDGICNFMVFACPMDTTRVFMICKLTYENKVVLHSSHIDQHQALFVSRCLRYMGFSQLVTPLSNLFK